VVEIDRKTESRIADQRFLRLISMYTECPDCKNEFEVTAEALKPAAGQVRCGRCRTTFDALSYLSKRTPERPAAKKASPDLPDSIAAETSAALLKTLDDLADSDVRIEDSGGEWLVVDEDEASSPVDELRFDDNTPLPDDFVTDSEESKSAASEPTFDIDEDGELDSLDEDEPPDVALSEPDEWKDLLGEFMDLAEEVAAPIASSPPENETVIANFEDSMVEPKLTEVVNEPTLDTLMDFDLSEIDEAVSDEDDVEPHDEIEQQELIDVEISIDEIMGDDPGEHSRSEHYVPPMTEEEHTANFQIDQELMALAVEDEDGFVSTIVIPEEANTDSDEDDDDGDGDGDGDGDLVDGPSNGQFVETIIMEGETIRAHVDIEKYAADVAAAAELAGTAEEDETAQAVGESGGPRYGMIAVAVLLMLTLAVQVIHQTRETLATIPAFSNTLGQLYRAIGQPVQPAWNITGWRFETTQGSTAGDNEDLTVYSRLGNTSAGPLPYPLIGISLTDRFEESIGSSVLDPAEYLQSDIDPRKLVEPGDTFDAVITIKSASRDATGFKLNVCYQLSNGQLRCAIDDFK
jgi:predicted Zn finger-like uncharacterized protein